MNSDFCAACKQIVCSPWKGIVKSLFVLFFLFSQSSCYFRMMIEDRNSEAVSPPEKISMYYPPTSTSNVSKPTIAVEGGVSGDTVYLFIDENCSAAKMVGSALVSDAVSAQNPTQVSVNATLSDGHYKFYSLVEHNQNRSVCSTTFADYTLDATGPHVIRATSSKLAGVYGMNITIEIFLEFNEPVILTHAGGLDPNFSTLELNLTPSVQYATYVSGNNTKTLHYTYTVQGGDNTPNAAAFDYASINAFQLNGDNLKDALGNDGSLILPLLGSGKSIAGDKVIMIDTTAPVTPTTLVLKTPASSPSSNSTPTLTVGGGIAAGDIVKIYTNSTCSSSVVGTSGVISAGMSTADITLSTLGAGAYTFYAKSIDGAGNSSSCSGALASPVSVDYFVDNVNPVITGVTATNAAGTYGINADIQLQVSFSSPINVTGSPEIALNTTPLRTANYLSGSGTSTLTFDYIVQTGDVSVLLDSANSTSLTLNGGSLISSISNLAANLTLPIPTQLGSLSASKNLVINATPPGAPAGLTLINPATSPSHSVANPTLEVTGTQAGDTVQLYSDSTCTTLIGTAVATGGTTNVTVSSNLIAGSYTFYAKLANSLGGAGACSTNFVNYTYDDIVPSVNSVTSTANNGGYGAGSLTLQVVFSEVVTVDTSGGTPQLALNVTPLTRYATYDSGSGSNTLNFIYTIGTGDESADLDYAATGSLSANGGLIQDLALNNATLSLPSPGTPNSLGFNKDLLVSTQFPTALTGLSLATPSSSPGHLASPEIVVSGTSAGDTIKLFSDSSCSNNAQVGAGVANGATTTLSVTPALNPGSYQFYARATNGLNISGACSLASVAYEYDATAPTILGVSASNANGIYKVGDVINIEITWSEVVSVDTSGGLPSLDLAIAPNLRAATYSSGSGSTVLVFSYTISAGDTANDLDYAAVNALANHGALITDLAGNSANLTLAVLGETGSLGDAKSIVIDTTPPSAPSGLTLITPSTSPGAVASPVVEVSGVSSSDTVKLFTDALCTVQTGSSALASGNTVSLSPSALSSGSYIFYASSTDSAGNVSPCSGLSANLSYTYDGIAPAITDVTSAKANGSYATGTVSLQVTFSEVVIVDAGGGIPSLLLNTVPARSALYQSGSGTNTLSFTYSIVSGDVSSDLDYASSSALNLNGATLTDSVGHAALLTLASPGASFSLGFNKDLVIDASVPSVVAGLALSSPTSTPNNVATPSIVVTGVVSGDTVKLFTDVLCATEVGSATASGTSVVITSSALVSGSTTTFYANRSNSLGTTSLCSLANVDYAYDGVSPTVTDITSSNTDNSYGVGASIDVSLNFSENVSVVTSGGNPSLTLNTSPQRSATYVSGSGTSTLHFSYTVQTGDSSSDLDYTAVNSLNLNGGFITDSAGNNAVLALFAPSTTGSLAANKNIVINTNTVAPVSLSQSIITVASSSVLSGSSVRVTLQAKDSAGNFLTAGGLTVTFSRSGGTSTGVFSSTTDQGDGTYSALFTGLNAGTATTITAAIAGAQVISSSPTVTVIEPPSAPTGLALSQPATSPGNSATPVITVSGVVSGNTVNLFTDLLCTMSAGSAVATGTSVDVTLNPPLLAGTYAIYASTLAANGLTSPCSSSSVNYTYDNTAPTVASVTTSTLDGTYGAATVITLQILFSEVVNVNASSNAPLTLALNTNPAEVATYVGGNGTNTLNFTYVVGNGDSSAALDYAATTSLALNGASTLKDSAGNAGNLTLASPGAVGSLSHAKTIVIDAANTVGPLAPNSLSLVSPASSPGKIATPSVSVGGVSAGDTVTLYTDLLCTMPVVSGAASGNSIVLAVPASTPLLQGNYTFYARTTNSSGESSTCSTVSLNYIYDATPPTVASVQSPVADGTYTTNDTIPIVVTFSEMIKVTLGSTPPTLTLNTTTPRTATFLSGGNGNKLQFVYLVQASDTSARLGNTLATALSAGNTVITDSAGNSATLTLPISPSVNSLQVANNIVIATSPVITPSAITLVTPDPADIPYSNLTPTLSVAGVVAGHNVMIYGNATCTGPVLGSAVNVATTQQVTISPALTSGNYTFYALQQNSAGMKSTCSTANLSYPLSATLSFTKIYQRVSEGSGVQNFGLELNQPLANDLTVNFDVQESTATTSLFSLPSTSNITIPAGQTSANIPVTILSNGVAEAEKVLQLNLVSTNSNSVQIRTNYNQSRMYLKDTDSVYDSAVYLAPGSMASHSCSINSSGALYCWGSNSVGQLGIGTTTDSATPVLVDAGVAYAKVAVGGASTCGITLAGVLKCWGYNGNGQVGDGSGITQTLPVVIDAGTSYTQVTLGDRHSCAITTTGALKCWGYNLFDQLGDGTTTNRTTPVLVESNTKYAQISAGSMHTCGITTAGVLKCWGQGGNGQLGTGYGISGSYSPAVVDSGVLYAQVGTGNLHSCGITLSGVLKCWGYNLNGQIGNGTTTQVNSPVQINNGTTYSKLSVGSSHTCAIQANKVLQCWGANAQNQLGISGGDKLVPTSVDSNVSYLQVSSGSGATCGLTSEGVVKCWGDPTSGQIGLNYLSSSTVPTPILSGDEYSSLAVGGAHACAINSAGALKCWGSNTYGQLADKTKLKSYGPRPIVDPGTNYSQVASGSSHSCGITTLGALKCWGWNSWGQLGNGTATDSSIPVLIDSGTSYSQIALGDAHSCGITSAGVLKCWGYQLYGRLGNGNTLTTGVTQPVVIDSGVTYAKVSLGEAASCGITSTGVLKCWGYNVHGQLGNNSTTDSAIPVVVDSGVTYSQVVLSGYHTCGITSAGVLKCWGQNGTYGQLGQGSLTLGMSSVPLVVDSGVSYRSVSAGYYNSCAVTTAGVLKCWGLNSAGQLGNSSTTNVYSPMAIDVGVAYSSVASMAKSTFNCGLTAPGASPANTIKCWGNNADGQLGLGPSRPDLPWSEVFGVSANASLVLGSGPTLLNITATPGAGSYGLGQSIVLHLQFSESVTVDTSGGTPSLALNVAPNFRQATYNGGSGTATLDFNYTVGLGDYALILDSLGYGALSLNGGLINATNGGAPASLIGPIPFLAGSLSANQIMVVNGNPPPAPSSITFVNPVSAVSGFATLSATINQPQLNVGGLNSGAVAKLYTDSSCTNLVATSSAATGTSVNLTTQILSFGEYSFYATATDSLGNTSACSTVSALYAYYQSGVPATIVNVTSPSPNGIYSAGQVLPIQVQFNHYISVTGTPTLDLNTSPPRKATYISGAGTKTLNFVYSITSGDTAADLDLMGTSALSLPAGGTITDVTATNANLNLMSPGNTGSLGANKDLVIGPGTALPEAPTDLSLNNPTTSPGTRVNPVITVSGGGVISGASVTLYADPLCSNPASSPTAATGVSVNVTVSTPLVLGSQNTFYANVTNSGSTSTCSAMGVNYVYTSVSLTTPTSLVLLTPASSPSTIANPTITVSPVTSGYLVSLYKDSLCSTDQKIGSATASDTSVAVTVNPNLPKGVYTFYADVATSSSRSSCSKAGLVYYLQESSLSFAKTYQRINEGSGLQNFDLTLASPLSYDLTVNYDLGNTSAPANLFSISSTSSLVIPAGQTTAQIPVNVLSNGVADAEKMVQININSTTPNTVYLPDDFKNSRLYIKDADIVYDSAKTLGKGALASHYCMIAASGALYCSGTNTNGQLGVNSLVSNSEPTLVDPGTNYVQVVMGGTHTCGITTSRVLKCWGLNNFGQLGINSTIQSLVPVVVDSGVSYAQIGLGQYHTCGITAIGALKCWGINTNGQLGINSTTQSLVPVAVDAGVNYSQVALGHSHACGITAAGSLKCWGTNSSGQLGNNSTTQSLGPVQIDVGVIYKAISLGGSFSCGLTSAGVLKCWGLNTYGQLGINSTTQSTVPVVVDGGLSYSQISTGYYHSCALKSDGVLKCWGLNNNGRLGVGGSAQSLIPLVVDSGTSYGQVSAFAGATCAVKAIDGVVKCWGGLSEPSPVPIRVDKLVSYSAVSTGGGFTCGKTSSGFFKCWGINSSGELGNGATVEADGPAPNLDFNTNFASFSLGSYHACGITSSGDLKCWGSNASGQLGNNSTVSSLVSTIIDPGIRYAKISLGASHTCGITQYGALKCWGLNTNGQLGNGGTASSPFPVLIDVGVNYSQVALGTSHTCGITTLGVLKCWGLNTNGRLGDGTTVQKTSPTVIDPGVSYAQVSLGDGHTCGITIDGVLKCWGLNSKGQVGDNSITQKTVPTVIDAGVIYTQVSVGQNHSCGLHVGGGVSCWGDNTFFQVGNNSSVQSLVPVPVDSGETYSVLGSMGQANHACAITSETSTVPNALKCWGNGSFGALGSSFRTDIPWGESFGISAHPDLSLTSGSIPSITNITADPGAGSYGLGQNITFHVQFSQNVSVNTAGGIPSLALNIGPANRVATYSGGTGTNTLNFSYTVAAGDYSLILDTTGYDSLALNGGIISAVSDGLAANLYVPLPFLQGSLSSNQFMFINTYVAPPSSITLISPAPAGIGMAAGSTTINTPQLSVGGLIIGSVAKLYSDSLCTTLVGTSAAATGSTVTITTSSLSFGSYTFYATATDTMGNVSLCSSANARYGYYDSASAATVTNVTSTMANGTYTIGQIIIQVEFNRFVRVGGAPTLKLNTTPAQIATYVSGSGTNTLSFSYSISSGDSSADLDFASTLALSDATQLGAISDVAGLTANLTLMNPGSAGSLGANKNLVINSGTVFPDVPTSITLVTPASSPGTIASPTVSVAGGGVAAGSTVTLFSDATCATPVSSGVVATGTSVSTTVNTPMTLGDTLTVFANVVNSGGNSSSCSTAKVTYVYTNSVYAAPTGLSLSNPLSSPSSERKPSVTITVSGYALINDTLQLYTTSTCTDSSKVGTSNPLYALATSGMVTVSSPLPLGEHVLYADLKSSDGRSRSPCSTAKLVYSVKETSLSFTQTYQRLNEGSGAQGFAVSLGSPLSYDVTVNFDNGNTSAGSNLYSMSSPTSIVIPAGQTTANIPVTILSNSVAEGEKLIQLNLLSTTPNTVAVSDDFRQSRIYIKDTDSVPDLTLKLGAVSSSTGDTYCAIAASGKLYCWGYNGSGNLGNNTTVDSITPVLVDGGISYREVSQGISHSCGITISGVLKCWGQNTSGQLGNNSTTASLVPIDIDSGVTYRQVSTDEHTCAITTAGVLKCWGLNTSGELGNNSTTNSLVPIIIDAGVSYAQVSAGPHLTCAITTAGVLKCWGDGSWGQLPGLYAQTIKLPRSVDSTTTYSQVALGYRHVCAITTTGQMKCWGDVTYGQTGADVAVVGAGFYGVVDVDSSSKYLRVATGANHSCGLTTAGVLKCWGRNNSNQVGKGLGSRVTAPAIVDSGTSFSQIALGAATTCGVTRTGIVKCWGSEVTSNGYLSSLMSPPTPVIVDNGVTYSEFSEGSKHTCAMTSAGMLKCWGSNTNTSTGVITGQLGNNSSLVSANPIPIEVSTVFSKVALGNLHSCGITNTNLLKCWGSNGNGQLGDGTTNSSLVPLNIDGGVKYAQVALGNAHTCAITTTGILKCWGLNTNGQLGNNSTVQSSVPVVIDSGTTYSDVALGTSHTCGITTASALKCWGLNSSGQLGDGGTTQRTLPAVVDTGVNYSKNALGNTHTCGITTTGVLKCWGSSNFGQVGNGLISNSTSPQIIDSGVSYAAVATGLSQSCGITLAGVLKCWGKQIANGSVTSNYSPVIIDSGVAYGKLGRMSQAEHLCAITAATATPANTLKCWGTNSGQQLGLNYRTDIPWTEFFGLGVNGGASVPTGSIPYIANVTANPTSGSYGLGQQITFHVQFSQAVTVNTAGGTPSLALNLTPIGRVATYSGGSGTDTLDFIYTVAQGDYSMILDSAGYSSLSLNGGTINGTVGGLAANLYVPIPFLNGSLSANQLMFINANPPEAPSTISLLNPASAGSGLATVSATINQPQVTVGGVYPGYLAKLYTDSSCSTLVGLSGTATGTSGTLTTQALAYGEYSFYATTSDSLGNVSACSTATAIYAYYQSGVPATITDITSPLVNGTYTNAQVNLQMQFSRYVNVVGVPTLALNTIPPRLATYVSGSGTKTLNFIYSIVDGDNSADLDILSTAALELTGGSIIADVTATNATLTLMNPGSLGSLGANKDIVIGLGATLPEAPTRLTLGSPSFTPNSVTTPTIAVTGGGVAAGAAVTLYSDLICANPISAAATATGTSVSVTVANPLAVGVLNKIFAKVSVSGNSSACSKAFVYYMVTTSNGTAPTGITLLNPSVSPGTSASPSFTVTGISGSVSSPYTVKLFKDPDCVGTVMGSAISTTSSATVTVSPPLTNLGTYVFYANQTNSSGSSISSCTSMNATYTFQESSLGFATTSQRVAEGSGTQSMTFKIPAPLSYPVTVNFDLGGSTASSDLFSLSNGLNHTVTIPAGDTSVSLGINAFGNGLQEGDKLLQLNITGTTPNTVFVNQAANQTRMYFKDQSTLYDDVAVVAQGSTASHSCVIKTSGQLYCWGFNSFGQVGNGSLVDQSTPILIDSGVTYKAVALGSAHTCAITSASANPPNALKCWGKNGNGQLGDGTLLAKYTPVVIDAGVEYSAISLGASHSCALTSATANPANRIKCWGFNSSSQLGDGSQVQRALPTEIDSGVTYSSLSSGAYHTCAITSASNTPAKALKCWGYNGSSQLGDGTQNSSSVPVEIDAGTTYSVVSSGVYHTCAVTSSSASPAHRLKCWGDNFYSELGDGTQVMRPTPTAIHTAIDYEDVSSGAYGTCGRSTPAMGSTLYCWGSNSAGQVGDGSLVARSTPVPVATDRATAESQTYIGVASSFNHVCALHSTGSLFCWGNNSKLQLGQGAEITLSLAPQYIDSAAGAGGSSNFIKFANGSTFSCGITESGALKCWGINTSGQLGNNSTNPSVNSMALVDSGVSYVEIAAGTSHACGITSAGVLKCWGLNASGQLGINSTTQSLVPVVVDPGVTYVKVAAGTAHTCGITSATANPANTVKCWGLNTNGRLGNNTQSQSLVPVVIDTGVPYSVIAVGGGHTCGITSATAIPASTLKCWGLNTNGQLGNNSTAQSLVPVVIDTGVNYSEIATGTSHTCGITSAAATPANALNCWGLNTSGQVGNNSTAQSLVPVVIDSGVSYSAIVAGGSHTCGITSATATPAKAVKCWGSNSNGRLGNNSTATSLVPVVIDSGINYSSLAVMSQSTTTCGLTEATATTPGMLKCWGLNANLQSTRVYMRNDLPWWQVIGL